MCNYVIVDNIVLQNVWVDSNKNKLIHELIQVLRFD